MPITRVSEETWLPPSILPSLPDRTGRRVRISLRNAVLPVRSQERGDQSGPPCIFYINHRRAGSYHPLTPVRTLPAHLPQVHVVLHPEQSSLGRPIPGMAGAIITSVQTPSQSVSFLSMCLLCPSQRSAWSGGNQTLSPGRMVGLGSWEWPEVTGATSRLLPTYLHPPPALLCAFLWLRQLHPHQGGHRGHLLQLVKPPLSTGGTCVSAPGLGSPPGPSRLSCPSLLSLGAEVSGLWSLVSLGADVSGIWSPPRRSTWNSIMRPLC